MRISLHASATSFSRPLQNQKFIVSVICEAAAEDMKVCTMTLQKLGSGSCQRGKRGEETGILRDAVILKMKIGSIRGDNGGALEP